MSERTFPLPTGWECKELPSGEITYINHATLTTHWTHPFFLEPDLPAGWENVVDENGVVTYYNHKAGMTIKKHPGNYGIKDTEPHPALKAAKHCSILRKSALGASHNGPYSTNESQTMATSKQQPATKEEGDKDKSAAYAPTPSTNNDNSPHTSLQTSPTNPTWGFLDKFLDDPQEEAKVIEWSNFDSHTIDAMWYELGKLALPQFIDDDHSEESLRHNIAVVANLRKARDILLAYSHGHSQHV